ncbi:MAG: hypothetical protein KC417_15815 [Myxococcales bacterium]|nr:hypothetical protein [Myxococcales bacterium]
MRLWILVPALLTLAACGGRVRYTYTQQNVYTQTNLHIDERGNLWSMNYIEGTVLPRCTAVHIDAVSTKKLVFTVQSSRVSYEYAFDRRHMKEEIPQHLNRYFGPACDAEKPASMGEADQAGIRDGRIYAGMSKEGVLMAVGYPPPSRNPTLESNTWVYMKNRKNTLEIIFVDGFVQYLREQ